MCVAGFKDSAVINVTGDWLQWNVLMVKDNIQTGRRSKIFDIPQKSESESDPV